MRDELQAALTMARTIEPDALPYFLSEIEEIRVTALARLMSSTTPDEAPIHDKLLSVRETAARLNCSVDYLYRNAKKLPFARPNAVGRRLLFSALGLDRYLKNHARRGNK